MKDSSRYAWRMAIKDLPKLTIMAIIMGLAAYLILKYLLPFLGIEL